MRTRRGCRLAAFLALFLLVACLVFAALAAGLFMTGELPAYEPRLTGLEPRPGFSFRPTTPITLTFDQPMDRASVESSFALAPAVAGTFAWNEDHTQVVFQPSGAGFEPGMRYRARLADGARGALLPRTTRNAVEWGFALPPLLDGASPAPGTGGLGPLPSLEAHFNYSLDCDATSQSFVISPAVAGTVDCQEGAWSFTPSAPLEADRAYSAALEQVYLEGDPAPRPGPRWQFRTAPPLLIVDARPAVEEVVSDLWTPVRITFNRPPLAETVEGRFRLAGADDTPVEGAISWENGGTTLVFQPSGALKPLSSYRWRLEAGVQDALGFTLDEAVARPFDTRGMIGIPDPGPDAEAVDLDRPLHLSFTRPMDRDSVAAGLAFTPAVEGEITWEGDTLVFTPRDGWRGDTAYEVHLDAAVRDASGAPLAATLSWTFRSEPLLAEASLPAGEVLRLGQPLVLRFALPMDRASVQRALTIVPDTPGDLTWSDGDRTLTFQPQPGWLPGSRYRVGLSGAARAADRRLDLGQAQSWTFATALAEVRFGSGPNLQVVGAGGERVVQLAVRGADVADFRLYPITETQLLELYHPGFWDEDAGQARVLDTAELTPTLQWYGPLPPLDGDEAGNGWRLAQAHLPAELPAGFYLLSAEPPAEEASQLLVVLTGHSLALKRALAGPAEANGQDTVQILAWDTEIQGGAPLVSATLSLYDAQGALLGTAVTGEDGLATFEPGPDPGALWVLSDREGDRTVAGLDDEWSAAGWWSWGVPPPLRSQHTVYAYTDRPIYRPGQTVFFKAIIRAGEGISLTLPGPDLPVGVGLRDARGNLVASQVLTPTQFGTVHGEFRLADEPALGTWRLELEVGGTAASLPLEVQEYRKPEYEVVVATPHAAYGQGEAISVTVSARTLSGQAVAGAEVELRGYAGPESWTEGQGLPRFFEAFAAGTGRTDDAGQWTTSLVPGDLLAESPGGRLLLALEATVTGDAGQSVTGYATVSLHPAPHELSLLLEPAFFEPGQEIQFAGRLADLAGGPLAGVELQASVVDFDDREIGTATAPTDETGQAHFSIRIPDQGAYRVRLAEPAGGLQVEDSLWVYDASGQAPWHIREMQSYRYLSVAADREEYQVGEEALVVVQSLAPGPALLTLERGEVLDARPLSLVAGTNVLTVPIEAAHVPNVYLQISQYVPSQPGPLPGASQGEAELYSAGVQLLVPAAGGQLSVTLTAEDPAPGPGEKATFQVQVTDARGRPAVAEVSLAVVDGAIAALLGDRATDPFAAFYGPRPNNVSTFDSLRLFRALYPERGMGGAEEEMARAGAPRRAFLDTAYWAPAVVTGADGRAELTLTLPDNLTTWSALARAVTTDTQVGQATARLVISREISLQPAAPRFLVQGDTFTMTVAVRNATARPVSATVELDAMGLSLEGRPQQVVHVPAGGAGVAAWPLQAGAPGEVILSLRTTATYGGTRVAGRDAVELSLPVLPLALPEVTALAGSLGPEAPTATLTLTLPADAPPDLARLELELAPSVAGALLDGLDYLLDYPYGCVEQTMSRVLPNAVVAQAFERLGVGSERLESEMPAMVDQGLQRLYGFQHEDGGWGWWRDDDSRPGQTAYVLLGLATTRQAGFQVDDSVVERGTQALTAMLPEASLPEQAYASYALAAAGHPLTITVPLSDALGLDAFSRAALAIAADEAGDSATTEALLGSLQEAAVQDGVMVHWEADDLGGRDMGSTIRTTALVAHALARLDPSSPLLPGAARWLMDHRAGRGWGDTQRTSFAILALADYALAAADSVPATYQVTLNGVPWQAGVLQGAAVTGTLVLTAGQELSPTLLPGVNRVDLVLEGQGARLYYVARLQAWRNAAPAPQAEAQAQPGGIGLSREVRKPGGEEPAAELKVGDLVEVVLTLDVPEESWYVVVEDPLPAGLEALNDLPGGLEQPVGSPAGAAYERKEVHDERVVFFFASLPPGEHVVSYRARATVAGDFAALPVQAHLMYQPEAWSRSAMVADRYQILR